MSKSLFVASTSLLEKMIIYLHNDKLWGNYNSTGAFKGLIILRFHPGMKLLLRNRVEISSHLAIVFNIKNKLRLHVKK